MTAAVETPYPRAVLAQWWPATVLVPVTELNAAGEPETRQVKIGPEARVYATDAGLIVYRRPDKIEWWSPITPGQAKPITGYAARNGVYLDTDAGLVTITKQDGCGCGNPLKRYVPAFSTNTKRWT